MIPRTARTLILITVSLNVRLCFFLIYRRKPTFTIGKICGRRILPYGCTQLCLRNIRTEFDIYMKLNSQAREHIHVKTLTMPNYPPDVYMLYITSHNYFINRPLSLKHICLPILYENGLTKRTVLPSELPETLRKELLFPKRRPLRYLDMDGDEIVYVSTCTTCDLCIL